MNTQSTVKSGTTTGPLTHEERNTIICKAYVAGEATQEELGQRFGITEARVGQILHRQGITSKNKRLTPPKRTAYVGANISPSVKAALERRCYGANISQSQWVATAIEEQLKREGIEIKPPAPPVGSVPLPFEATV